MSEERRSCLGCTERKVGCHSTCEDYKAYQAEMEAKRKARYFESSMGAYGHDAAERVRTRQGKSFLPKNRRMK